VKTSDSKQRYNFERHDRVFSRGGYHVLNVSGLSSAYKLRAESKFQKIENKYIECLECHVQVTKWKHQKDVYQIVVSSGTKRDQKHTYSLCMHVSKKHMRYSLMSPHLNQYLTNPPKGKFGAKPEGIDKI